MTSAEIKKLFEALEPVMGDVMANSLYLSYLLAEGFDRQRIIEKVQVLVQQKVGIIYKPTTSLPPPADLAIMRGRFKLADVHYPPDSNYGELGLNENELLRHILISGMTGSGKTTLALNIAGQMHGNKIPFWVFDWKGTWKDRLKSQGIIDNQVFRIGAPDSLKIDIFEPPPGVPQSRWLDIILLVMQVGYFLAEGSEYIINQGLGEFEKGQKMTLELLEYQIQKKYRRGREGIWKAPVLRALSKLTSRRCLANTLNSAAPKHRIADLIGKNIIFEFSDVVHLNDRIFMTCLLLNYLNEFLRCQPLRNELLMSCFIEDAHNIYNRAAEDRMAQQNIMDLLMDEIREFGVCMVIITLQPSKVSSSCKANTYTKISFNLGNGDDIKDIASCMFLDFEQTKSIDLCDVGECIIKLKGRFFEPVYCKIQVSWE